MYINDLLHLVPSAKAFADDITLTHKIEPGGEAQAERQLRATLRRIADWGSKWQVKFAPAKTQLLVVARTPVDLQLEFEGLKLTPREEVEVLGLTYDSRLTFRTHIQQLARAASRKLTSLSRISWLMDSRGREVLYKAQIRSSLEYSCLTWGGAASTHLALLDKIQERAWRIITDRQPEHLPTLQTLQHRRDVATTLYKIQQEGVEHLRTLRQPEREMTANTRSAEADPTASGQLPQQFTHRQQYKLFVNQWLNNL